MSGVSNIGEEVGAMTVKEFSARYRLGHTKIYEEISAGRLRAVKCGTRTLILARDAAAWERSLPTLAGG
jgi:excisionase family DNA binding protein